ncbi:MAG: transcriptional regulator [Candidatus Cloacimonas sp. 4484_209]|nr:MAG: transcriptional regulator [Candidatus Cloacimonas sp. 4484_209]
MEVKLEQKDRDYKEKFGDRVLKDLSAFANTEGGSVIIGVSKTGKIKGINLSNKELERLTEKIVGKLVIHPDIEIEKIKGKKILKISVQKSRIPVSFDGKYFERVGNTTREMKPERLRQFFLKGTNWDSIINEDAKFNEIDEETVKMFIRMGRAKGRLRVFDENTDIKTLFEHLKLSNKDKLTNAAIILFGKDPQKYFLNAALRVIRLKNEITPIGDRLIDGNLFRQVVEGEEAIKNFLGVRYEIKKLVREEIWDYPLPAIREALINALIHRDYFRWNVQTQIKIFDDYIWFYNIGGLPEGITLEQLKEPHSSVPRNPLIVHIFYLAGLIEEMGTGIERIMEAMSRAGLPEPEFKEEMGGFSVYFRKDIYTEEYLRKMGLNERQIKAVMYVKEKGKITNREYQGITGISRQMATIDLKQLVEKGVLIKTGKAGAGIAYQLPKLPNK